MNAITRSLSALPIDRVARHPDIVLAFLVIGVLAVMIVPVPPFMLDVLLATNVTLSTLILAAVLLSDRALAISVEQALLPCSPFSLLTCPGGRVRLACSRPIQCPSQGEANGSWSEAHEVQGRQAPCCPQVVKG